MKWKNLFSITLGAFLLISAGCGSSGSTAKQTKAQNDVESSSEVTTLEDYLRRLTGVQVSGRGADLQVSIRSNMSIADLNEQPLYVLNGQEIGNNFNQVYWLVDNQSIISVEAIPPSRASVYGMRGGAGVIVINTE